MTRAPFCQHHAAAAAAPTGPRVHRRQATHSRGGGLGAARPVLSLGEPRRWRRDLERRVGAHREPRQLRGPGGHRRYSTSSTGSGGRRRARYSDTQLSTAPSRGAEARTTREHGSRRRPLAQACTLRSRRGSSRRTPLMHEITPCSARTYIMPAHPAGAVAGGL